jgi:hypothetical protein
MHGNLASSVASLHTKLDAVMGETKGLSAVGQAFEGEVPELEEGESARTFTRKMQSRKSLIDIVLRPARDEMEGEGLRRKEILYKSAAKLSQVDFDSLPIQEARAKVREIETVNAMLSKDVLAQLRIREVQERRAERAAAKAALKAAVKAAAAPAATAKGPAFDVETDPAASGSSAPAAASSSTPRAKAKSRAARSKCAAKTKKGTQCGRLAMNDSPYCAMHQDYVALTSGSDSSSDADSSSDSDYSSSSSGSHASTVKGSVEPPSPFSPTASTPPTPDASASPTPDTSAPPTPDTSAPPTPDASAEPLTSGASASPTSDASTPKAPESKKRRIDALPSGGQSESVRRPVNSSTTEMEAYSEECDERESVRIEEITWVLIKARLHKIYEYTPENREFVDDIVADLKANAVGLDMYYPSMLVKGAEDERIPRDIQSLCKDVAECEDCGTQSCCRKDAIATVILGVEVAAAMLVDESASGM